MSYDLTALPDFVKENAKNIVTEAILGFESKPFVTIQPGILSSENISKLVTDAVFQAGGCGWSPNGLTTLTQRNLAVTTYKVQEAHCSEIFNRTFLQVLANAGAMSEDIPLERIYVDRKILEINNTLESKIWNETALTGDFDGFLSIFDLDTPGGNKIARTGSIIDDLDALIALFPDGALSASGLNFYMSRSNYMKLMNEVRDKNWFHIMTGNTQAMRFTFPGTNITVLGISGFGASNTILLANKANLFMGTDLESDFDNFKYEFKDWEDEHRFNFKCRIGTQIAIPEEVVGAE